MPLGARTTGGIVSVAIANGGTGYTAPPSPVVSGGGTGAVLYSQLAGTAVGTVVIQAAGTGYTAAASVSFTGGGGTGAAGTAYGYAGAIRPLTFFKGRYGDVYGVDGMGRGVRWDGASTTVQPIGLSPPAYAPNVTAGTAGSSGSVRSVQIVSGGNGYSAEPNISFTGVTPSRAAVARATMSGGRVTQIKVIAPGAGYARTPQVTFSGGIGNGATFTVGVLGSVNAVTIVNAGSGFATTSTAACVFHNTQGLADAFVKFTVDADGRLDNAIVVSGGTGATGTGITASVPGGTGAVVLVGMRYEVNAVTVGNSGAGYYAAPVVTFRANAADVNAVSAAATAFANATGNVTGVTAYAGGQYSLPPTAIVQNTQAIAQAETKQALRGQYLCAVRYLDDTPAIGGGPRASSISELKEVDATAGLDSLAWSLSHGTRDSRVAATELWRTTADQSVLLFRVATIPRSASDNYLDSLTDEELRDPDRDGYALMPVTLPSGQINARRFVMPPGEFAIGCMFQDRAWYAVDTTGNRPNALMFSEVDEPESVPDANELILQENTGDPDKIVGLIPLGGYLLVAQQSHLYKLSYVAQPVIDASIILTAYRGLLNSRCWDVLGGVALVADGVGFYAFDGSREEALSVAVDNLWRDGIIDFSKADKFHVRADFASRTVRFFYCRAEDSEPVRALCYCISTKAWWEELYTAAVTATCQSFTGGRRSVLYGTSGGVWQKPSPSSGEVVPYAIRTGAFPLATEGGSRAVSLVYDPTASDATLNLRVHYNNSSTPRANAVATDRGTGFVTETGATAASLNLNKARSALGDATGFATANFAGRVSRESGSGDRHVAIAFDGANTASDPVRIHSIQIEGATT